MSFSATAAAGQTLTGRTAHGDRIVTGQSIFYGSLFKLAKGTSSTVHLPNVHTKNVVHLRHTTCGCDDYGIVNMKP